MTQGALVRRFVAVASFGFVLAFSPSPTLRAYVLEGASWPAGSTVTFQMALGSAGRTLSDGNTSWDVAAAPAPGIWDGVMQRLQFVTATNPSAPVSSGDHVNVIAFSGTVFGQSFGSNTLAVTYYRYSGGTMSEADVLFNNRQNFDSYRGALRFGTNGYAISDIRRVLIHELGHALGLDHPDQHGQRVSAIMNSVISNVETLTSDDISGAQAIYGAGQPSATPTPIPTPSPTPPPAPAVTLPTVSVSASPTGVRRGGTANYTISVSSVNPTATVTVRYAMAGRAILGRNYTLSDWSGQVTIPAGASSANVTLTVLRATRRARAATMVLMSGTDYNLSSSGTASITIRR
jgi:hypothetical protein